MGSLFVVNRHPSLRFCSGVSQRREAIRVEYLNAIGAVESLDVRVLSRTARFDKVPGHVVGFGPRLHRVALELRAVVAADHGWFFIPLAELFQHANHAATTDAEVDLDSQRVACEVVDHVEGSERPAVGPRAVYEVHGPACFRLNRLHQRLPLAFRGPTAAETSQCQFLLAIQSSCPLVVDEISLLPHLAMQLWTAPGGMRLRQLHQSLRDAVIRHRPSLQFATLCRPGLRQYAASPPLTDLLILNLPNHRSAALTGRQNFFVGASFRIE